LLAGVDFVRGLEQSANFPFVSANIVDKESGELLFKQHIVVERGGLIVGITGITSKIPDIIENLTLKDPVQAANEALAYLEKKSDYQIVLFNGYQDEAKTVRQQLISADFMFLSGDTRNPKHRAKNPESGPWLYSLGKQSKYLAILRLDIRNSQESVNDITTLKAKESFILQQIDRMQQKDPSKTLEQIYADNPKILDRLHQIQTELESVSDELAQVGNSAQFDFVPMSRILPDEPLLLNMVTETLSACDRLAVSNDDHRELLKNTEIDPAIKRQIESKYRAKKSG
jgi:2',3'-cyclic-nucleotide 2'-phosphodiesterase (5'-nucleotidase family)|tara:strand:- start:1498 stop:2355 length:858 start_codon:yes stop_codon:yes gene_type:complete